MIVRFRLAPVPRWYTPFSLTTAALDRLETAGLTEGEPHKDSIDLWIYDAPDRILDQWRDNSASPPAVELLLQQLQDGYQTLLSNPPGRRLISGWRLEQLEPQALSSWLSGETASPGTSDPARLHPPEIQTFSALLALRLLEQNSQVLENFLDLELQSQLLSGPPDSDYLGRLHEACRPSALLNDWWEIPAQGLRLQALQADLSELNTERHALQKDRTTLADQLQDSQSRCREAQDAVELNKLQLNQVQEELDTLFLRFQEQEKQCQSQAQDLQNLHSAHDSLQAANQQLTTERDTLTAQLQDSQSSCTAAQSEAELNKLQLNQVQEELEHYFLLYRKQGLLLDEMNNQQRRALQLLARASHVYVHAGPAQTARATGA